MVRSYIGFGCGTSIRERERSDREARRPL